MNNENLNILNAIPLVDVMHAWGHVPRRESDLSASYLCPWHDDHRPSLVVDKVVRDGATDLGFKCFACGQEGYGALNLAARLLGLPAGKIAKDNLEYVAKELAERCDIELKHEDGEKRHFDHLRVSFMGLDEFRSQGYQDWSGGEPIFERGEWTEEGLKALGLKVELATRKAKKKDIGDGRDMTIGESGLSSSTIAAEIKVGDLITQFNPDNGEPLYRCSFGKDFYRGPQYAETRTIREWGEEIERVFGVEPISRFIQLVEPKNGGHVARICKATNNYPIFIFKYPWGIKKYEPRDAYGNKWTWWCVQDDADLYHQWYADAALTDVLSGAVPEQDERHGFDEVKDKDGKPTGKIKFHRVVICSGPRDAMAVYSHSNAHVIWLHSEQAGFDNKGGNMRPNRWLRSLIKKLLSVTVEGGLFICYDEDNTGLSASQAIALNSPNIHWLRLPKELSLIMAASRYSDTSTLRDNDKTKAVKPLKDVTDFILHFNEVERRMPAEIQHDDPVEWFDNALFDTPTCQFWQWESERKEKDGTGRARYKFDLRNTPVFLRARGMIRRVVQQGKDSFSRYFLLGNDNIYTECFMGSKTGSKLIAQARDLMAEWLRAHKEQNDEKGALSRAIYSAKLEQGVLESIEQVDIDEKSFGEDFDYFFFKNCAVRVTADEVKLVPYSQMKQWTNRDAIMDGTFSYIHQDWHVEKNPLYEHEQQKHEEVLKTCTTKEEVEQENMRWDSWTTVWKYRLVTDKPISEMPVHFQFLYNTSRIFWEKELAGQQISATEKQVQDMYFIAMLHALGSALVRHRSANRQQFIHITDNGTRREDLASGGTGKTAILELLGLMRRALCIDGKSLEGGNIVLEQELGKVVPGIHNIVCIDELPDKFSPKKMYNYPLSVTSRGLYEGSIKLTGDDVPKFVVASNEQIDISSDSTSRRDYQVLVSDWYHPRSIDGSRPSHTPADDFRKYGVKEVARNLSATHLNEARNLLIGCTQLFFQFPDETIRPPKDSRALLRQALASTKDEQFTRWIAGYLSKTDKDGNGIHIGTPIAQRELAISLLDYCGITVGEKTIKSAYKRIRDNLYEYIRTSVYVVDPPVVLLTATDRDNGFRRCATWQHPVNSDGSIKTDKNGERLPRELIKKAPYPRVYYFYKKGDVPKHLYDVAHEGDSKYVQAAPEIDPEAEVEE